MTWRRFVFALVLCAVSHPARAQHRKRAIVVPTELGGYFAQRGDWRYEYNRAIENRLRGASIDVVRDALSPKEADCRDMECLIGIANAHRVDLVIAARVYNNGQRLTSYALRVNLVERPASGAPPAGRSRERMCDNSTESRVRDELVILLSSTLANEPPPPPVASLQPKPAEAPSNAPPKPAETSAATAAPEVKPQPAPTTPPTDKAQAERERRRWIFRGLAIGLGAVGTLSLAQGIAEAAHNGDVVVRDDHRRYRENTTDGQRVFFALAGATLVTGAVFAAIGWWPKPKKMRGNSIAFTPDASLSGVGIHVQGTF